MPSDKKLSNSIYYIVSYSACLNHSVVHSEDRIPGSYLVTNWRLHVKLKGCATCLCSSPEMMRVKSATGCPMSGIPVQPGLSQLPRTHRQSSQRGCQTVCQRHHMPSMHWPIHKQSMSWCV